MSADASATSNEQVVAAAGVQPDNVLVVRITEASVEVDAIDVEDARWPVRTQRLAPADLRRLLGRHDLHGVDRQR